MAEQDRDKPAKRGLPPADPREQALAAALRANLRRRKAPTNPSGGGGADSAGE